MSIKLIDLTKDLVSSKVSPEDFESRFLSYGEMRVIQGYWQRIARRLVGVYTKFLIWLSGTHQILIVHQLKLMKKR